MTDSPKETNKQPAARTTDQILSDQNDPAFQMAVDKADRLLNSLKVARRREAEWKDADPGGVPSEIKLKETELASVEQVRKDLEARLSVERGDFITPSYSTSDTTKEAESETKAVVPAQPNWKMRIQTAATDHCLQLQKSGASPTTHSILDAMVKWCHDNNVKTDGKIFPGANYLRTHVLSRKYWKLPN
jgi:hypothetical protein